MNANSLKYGLIIGLLRMIAIMPLWVLYPISSCLCVVAHYVVRYRVKVVRKNLRNAFPLKSDKELRRIEKKFYRNFCDIIIETIKLLHISDRQLKRRVELINTELIDEIVEQRRPIIAFLGHCGNWEWVPALTLKISEPKQMGALYKPLRNKVMNKVILKIRSRFSQECIPVKSAYRRLLELKRQDKTFIIGFIADQRPVGQPLHNWTTFMGQPTAFMAGGETIGDKVDARFVYFDIMRRGRGRYSITFTDMQVDPDDKDEFPYTRLFYRLLENSINRQPDSWLWSHNRWSAKKPS